MRVSVNCGKRMTDMTRMQKCFSSDSSLFRRIDLLQALAGELSLKVVYGVREAGEGGGD